jgi:hypothetical protein
MIKEAGHVEPVSLSTIYQCNVCDPTAWLSELLRLGELIKISLDELHFAINPKKD